MSVTRIFVEKKPGFDVEAKHIQTDLTENLGIKRNRGVTPITSL